MPTSAPLSYPSITASLVTAATIVSVQNHGDVLHVHRVLGKRGDVPQAHQAWVSWSADQLVSEPDHDHTTEVYASSAATVTALTAMSITVVTMMIIVVIIMVSVLTTPIGSFVAAASIVASIVTSIMASIIPSTSRGRPAWRVTVMVAFRVLPTPFSIRVLGGDKTGNQQGNSQDRNELENLHKSPLSVG